LAFSNLVACIHGIKLPSRDGRIAFISDRDGNAEIHTMKSDGTSVVRLTDDPAIDTEPSWSPDGRKIAFCSDRDGDFEIYVMHGDGSGVVKLSDNGATDGHPVWSPDGKRIAFHSDQDGDFEIYVTNYETSCPRNLHRRKELKS
jgi:TolB protein